MDEQQKPYCLTVTIVGALTLPFDGTQLGELMKRIEQAIPDVFPDFLPGRPAVTVTVAELRDDWLGRHNQ